MRLFYFNGKDTNRNRTKVPRDRPERVQAAAGLVDTAPLQQAVASFVKEEEDPYFGCPPSDIVDCDAGFLKDSMMGTTCQTECDGKCCVGTDSAPDACEGFTGKVCKDEKSCFGRDACVGAEIGLVVGGCTGKGSCEIAYIKHGVIRGCIAAGIMHANQLENVDMLGVSRMDVWGWQCVGTWVIKILVMRL